ncbi:MAG TPA: winged helix-turn-helix domain-containing protein [Candidatus Nanoarchaeia archaeon]|nr:winged helix-turn-helix domain-containing protein [Candidatus Nanoarchaeia archaeon]
MTKKRTRLEVIKDILEVIKAKNGKIKPTHILYKSNLSYQMMEDYLDELKEKELIREQKLKQGRTYMLTDKGFSFLAEYGRIQAFTNSFGFE